jgi:two-component system repressor protein LuxO
MPPPEGATSAPILLVEDTPSMALLLKGYLERGGHRVTMVATGREALERLRMDLPEVVVLDLNLPDLDGRQVLAEAARRQDDCSVVVVTGDGSLQTVVEAMRAGAFDYVVKPVAADRLNTTVRNALERTRLRRKVDALERTGRETSLCDLIGTSPAMRAVYRTIEAAAPSGATVFLTGESGTGKELAAEAIHKLGLRHAGRFIALNCAAIPENLVESEIFGHVRGSFTGAVADRPGAASQANRGTLFLDEICEMRLDLQGKLLRFLQTGTFQPIGGSRLEQVDVRIICATNLEPWVETRAGRFREDLYYRLNVLPLRMPPLRERGDDVLLIARWLLARFAGEEGRRFAHLDPAAEEVLLAHGWPGNVRELENVLRNAVVMYDGDVLTADMLSFSHVSTLLASSPTASRADASGIASWSAERDIIPLRHVERVAVERAITLCNGNVPRAAAFLGVSPSTLYRKRQGWADEAAGDES